MKTLACLVVLAACGQPAKPMTSTAASQPLDFGTKLAALDAGGRAKLCAHVESQSTPELHGKLECVDQAFAQRPEQGTDAELQTGCRAAYASCMADPPKQPADYCATYVAKVAVCEDVTAGELVACWREAHQAAERVVAGDVCAAMTRTANSPTAKLESVLASSRCEKLVQCAIRSL